VILKIKTKGSKVFPFKVFLDPGENTDWEESQLEIEERIHTPAVGKLSLTMWKAWFFVFKGSIVIHLYLIKDTVLKM
jgi:hypothetical protein